MWILMYKSQIMFYFHSSVHSNVLKVNMSEEESCPEHQESAEVKERVVTVMLHESKLEKAFRAVCLNGAILSTVSEFLKIKSSISKICFKSEF